MNKAVLFASAMALVACHNSKKNDAAPVFEGYWTDSSGMATFEVQRQDQKFLLKNTMGTLEATLEANTLQGKTAQGFPFRLAVQGDQATYTIMDLDMQYLRISKTQYDSLHQIQTP